MTCLDGSLQPITLSLESLDISSTICHPAQRQWWEGSGPALAALSSPLRRARGFSRARGALRLRGKGCAGQALGFVEGRGGFIEAGPPTSFILVAEPQQTAGASGASYHGWLRRCYGGATASFEFALGSNPQVHTGCDECAGVYAKATLSVESLAN